MNIFSSSPKNRPPKVNDEVSAKVDIWSARHNQVVGTGGMYVGMIRKGSRGIVTSVSHLIEIEFRENISRGFPMSLKVQTRWPLLGGGGGGGVIDKPNRYTIRVKQSMFDQLFNRITVMSSIVKPRK